MTATTSTMPKVELRHCFKYNADFDQTAEKTAHDIRGLVINKSGHEWLETAFDMPYMGEDRCDDATRSYLWENIEKAKAGDPSGFQEATGTNLYH